MKTTIAILLFLFLSSITYRVRPKDCGCAVKERFYRKGKLVKTLVAPYGFSETIKNDNNVTQLQGKEFKYDSVSVTPTN